MPMTREEVIERFKVQRFKVQRAALPATNGGKVGCDGL